MAKGSFIFILTPGQQPRLAMTSDDDSDDDRKELEQLKRRLKRVRQEEKQIKLGYQQLKERRAARQRKREAAKKHHEVCPNDNIGSVTESAYSGEISINCDGDVPQVSDTEAPPAQSDDVEIVYIDCN